MVRLKAEAVEKIREICGRYKDEKTPLMMILSDIQNEYGYIPLEVQEIVSEETGIISMARDGKLERFLDSRTIEKKLLEFYLKGGDFSEKIVPMAKILVGRVKDRRGNDAKE